MPIHEWPTQERPREKLLKQGADSLSNAELLAIIINCGVRNKSAVDVAREWLQHTCSLRTLLNGNFESLKKLPGMGLAKYSQLQATLEIGKRYLQENLETDIIIRNSKNVQQFLSAKLRDLEHEVFAGLFLNNQHRIIRFEILFKGSIGNAFVHPREVVKKALHYNAAALIIAHNHPSGDPTPSEADIKITHRLQAALNLVEIRLLDHVIIGEQHNVSLADLGLTNPIT